MKDKLAEQLLARVMRWGPDDLARERPDLQALASSKYDGYQQFSVGMRFIESLALWLNQFDNDEDKATMYSLVKSKLILLSDEEMAHLVSISFPDYIRHYLTRIVAAKLPTDYWKVARIETSPEYKLLRRQSLFLGLSDGSRIDTFRRTNTNLSTEQIFRAHELTSERADSMLAALKSDGLPILGRPLAADESRFKIVFLLDDFSGSGISYIRKERTEYQGKVARFQKALLASDSGISKIVNREDVRVCLLLYVATERALAALERNGKELFGDIPFSVIVVQPLPNWLGEQVSRDAILTSILKTHYDSKIENNSYRKGKCDRPYLGFDECALPLILNHNTPNNSIPLLWFPEDLKWRGLFPRISRFSD